MSHNHVNNIISHNTGPSHDSMGMATSFEFNTHATIVFSVFQTHSLIQFLFASVILFCCGFGREYLSSYRKIILNTADRSNVGEFKRTSAILFVIVYSVDMCLMLAIMTYNIGIFFAILCGVGCGHYHFTDINPQAVYQKVTNQEEDLKVSSCC
jgi:hypothetical protein